MNTKLLTLAATGLAGVTIGLGVGVAAAQPDDDLSTTTSADIGSMDEMHAAMRDQMPPELAEQCDEMHAAMPDDMAAMEPGRMMGRMMDGMGDMMGGRGVMGGSMPADHDAHHGGNG